ncbi:type VI secretion system-associated protein VasI [Aeromonas jandaei]|uniref:type VI secretion system-associated protein VasI n=1 Tax=Aeromonas jandaei TaxID=650 RepID=UPI001ADD8910|nr:type VI secretion system-associated protein VasI [Aeromonas jandaei]QTL93218.1 hypothetical protein AjGTCBM29_01060 [Aeromonas jandaei]
MSLLALVPLLLASSAAQPSPELAQLQACRREPSPLVRLACYDAIGKDAAGSEEGAVSRSPAWQAILTQEQGRQPDSPPFLPLLDEAGGSVTLTRPALRGATLAIGCVNSITHIRLRLDNPWVGERVQIALDGEPSRQSQSWFVRDQGLLLEYGRGLPAIEELKRWLGARELQVQADNGAILRVDLSGLKEALQPVRQQCRW